MTDNKKTKQTPAVQAGLRDEREVFEEYMKTGVLDSDPNLTRTDRDNYDDWDVQRAWRGWQARAALARASEAAAGEPVAKVKGADEYGPILEWSKHWVELIGAKLYAAPQAASEQHCMCPACRDGVIHASDCAVHNGPAEPVGSCDCNASQQQAARGLSDEQREALEYALGTLAAIHSDNALLHRRCRAIRSLLAAKGDCHEYTQPWIKVEDGKPSVEWDEYYENDYSEPVAVMIDYNGHHKRSEILWRHCFVDGGWVGSDLREGRHSSDYESYGKVTHWARLPAPIEGDGHADK